MEIVLKLNSLPDLTMVEITKQLFNNEFLSDIQFDVGGKIIYAHSLELMKRSTVFQQELLNLDNKLIPITDVLYESFYQFMRFIYTDKFDVLETKILIDMLKLAIKYKVIRLENILINLLREFPMCLQLFAFCITENYLIPYKKSEITVVCDLYKYLADESFETIHFDVVEKILKFNGIPDDVTETDLLDAVIRWINNYREKNEIILEHGSNMFDRLLGLIRFPTMDIKTFASYSLKIGSLLTVSEYGIIFKQIAGHSEYINSKWNSTLRSKMNFIEPSLQLDTSITKLSVSNEVLLTGICIGASRKFVKHAHLHLSMKNTETQLIEVLRFRCYLTDKFSSSHNCLGDMVLLKPNYEYTLQIQYPNESKVLVRNGVEVNVTDPTDSVELESVSENIYELIFQAPV